MTYSADHVLMQMHGNIK